MSDDTTFLPGIGTVRACIDCGVLIAGGPTRCTRCADDHTCDSLVEAVTKVTLRSVAEQAQQPAPADVPPMPRLEERFASGRGSQASAYTADDVEALHAACVRLYGDNRNAQQARGYWHRHFLAMRDERDEARARLRSICRAAVEIVGAEGKGN